MEGEMYANKKKVSNDRWSFAFLIHYVCLLYEYDLVTQWRIQDMADKGGGGGVGWRRFLQ